MKLTHLTLLVIALCSGTAAQAAPLLVSNTPVSEKASVTVGVPAPAHAAAASTQGTKPFAIETNPFTGKSLTVEQIQMKLEAAKLETQSLEELLKQSNLHGELEAVPLRKAVEIAQARTNVKKEELNQRGIDDQVRAAIAASATAAASERAQVRAAKPAKPRTAKQKAADAKLAEEAAVQAPAPLAQRVPAPLKPVLLSVLDVAGAKSALFDFGGATLIAADGDSTPGGVLHVVDGGSATLNGELFKIRGNTISRFVVSDPKIESDATKSSPAGLIRGPGAPPANTQPATGVPSSVSPLPPLPSSFPGGFTNGSLFGAGAAMQPLAGTTGVLNKR